VPVGEPVAGQPPSTGHGPKGRDTGRMAWNISINWQRRQRLNGSKFNRFHLSHIKEDTGQPSVPVQEFNPIACPLTQPIDFLAWG